jgi:hypothetical protein
MLTRATHKRVRCGANLLLSGCHGRRRGGPTFSIPRGAADRKVASDKMIVSDGSYLRLDIATDELGTWAPGVKTTA